MFSLLPGKLDIALLGTNAGDSSTRANSYDKAKHSLARPDGVSDDADWKGTVHQVLCTVHTKDSDRRERTASELSLLWKKKRVAASHRGAPLSTRDTGLVPQCIEGRRKIEKRMQCEWSQRRKGSELIRCPDDEVGMDRTGPRGSGRSAWAGMLTRCQGGSCFHWSF